MANQLLRQLLIDEEGCKLEAYQDTGGKWHIGVGHNLEIEQTEEELKAMGVALAPPHDWSGFTITEAQAATLLDIDIEDAVDDLYPAFDGEELVQLNAARYAVLVSMVFQLGGRGVRKFKNFIAAVKEQNWNTAADEMMNSLAARQTPERWARASKAMRMGVFEKYETPQNKSTTSFEPIKGLDGYTSAELLAELLNREESKKK